MAHLIERIHPEATNNIAGEYIIDSFRLVYDGHLTLANAKTYIGEETGAALTEDEETEFDALWALRPDGLALSLLSLLPAVATVLEPIEHAPFYHWLEGVSAVFHAYGWQWVGFETASDVRGKLGLPTP
ncbi:MAG TPA: hypothetical protein VFZ21_30895 [Gemmatimonadaceae bacterium]|nr:hypothetical protein [Gemmatimonadaceae bacterium]